MSFLNDLDLNDAVEPQAVAEGEYEMRLISCELKEDKNDNPYILPKFAIEGEVGAKTVSRYMALPREDMDDEQLNRTKLWLKRLFDALGVDHTSDVDLEALTGETCFAILGLEEDPDYGEQNFIRRFVTK